MIEAVEVTGTLPSPATLSSEDSQESDHMGTEADTKDENEMDGEEREDGEIDKGGKVRDP